MAEGPGLSSRGVTLDSALGPWPNFRLGVRYGANFRLGFRSGPSFRLGFRSGPNFRLGLGARLSSGCEARTLGLVSQCIMVKALLKRQ